MMCISLSFATNEASNISRFKASAPLQGHLKNPNTKKILVSPFPEMLIKFMKIEEELILITLRL